MAVFYQLFIHLYGFLTRVYALFNKKARLMVRGRKQTWLELMTKINPSDEVVWFHCASLGEFEQCRVLIEMLKKENPSFKILLSFFSPSGYEVRKNYQYADCVVYLPNDTRRNARRLTSFLCNVRMVFFIKYEFWYNYLTYLKQWNKRTYQVSLILRQDHYLLKPYSKWFRGKLSAFSHFFVQNEQTADLLRSIGYTNCSVCGDTRFDRVAQIAQHTQDIKIIEQFCASSNVLLLGSSWEEDERILQKAISGIANLKIIITPHQIHSSHLDYILSLFPSAILYTDLTQENINQSNIIIINCIGILSSLYKHCTLAYIGGGFGEGIHNTLEAAVFGKPICFGPNYHKFKEAVDLIAGGGARSIENEEDLKHFLNLLQDEQAYNQASSFCTNYVQNNVGASQRVMAHVQKDYDRVAEILSNR